MSRAPFLLAPLDVAHDRSGFNSNSEPLNRYLREQVTQDIRRRVAACFVALADGQRIAGYYTLASASLLLTDPCEPHRAPELGFVAGVALADAAREALGRPPGLGLKWPNDLVCDGAKLSGMLLEATRLPGGDFVAVIGIGVNCRSHPEGLAYPTTDLETLRPGAGDPAAFFALLSDALARALAVWARGEGFAAIRDLWLSACLGRGGPIRVALGERVIEGTFDTIDQHGRLVVLTGEGAVAIDAGDVLLGPREAARPQGRT